MDLVYFTIVVSVLIFVHELGHFAFAKIFGVKVLMFSIGFGPKIVRLRGRETEYCIGVLPLGGFVKMLEQNRREPVLPEDRGRTFEAQPLYKRAIIVLAGPAMNLIFPVLLYLGVFVGETDFLPPTVGVVLPGHPAQDKLEPGDRVLEINDEKISTYVELQRAVRKNPGHMLKLKVFRNNEHVEVMITPEEKIEPRALGIVDRVGAIGIGPRQPAAVVGIRDARSPAYRAGLRTFDLVTEVRAQSVKTYADLERVIAENRGETVPVTYLRPKRVQQALGTLGDLYVYESGLAALTPEVSGADLRERTGMERADLYVADVTPNSPEWQAGIRPGDRIETVDDAEVASWSTFDEALRNAPGHTHTVTWLRGGKRHSGSFKLSLETIDDESGTHYTPVLGSRNWAPGVPSETSGTPSLWRYSLPRAVEETVEVARFIVTGIVQIAQGKLSLSTIGGPVTVYDVIVQERQKGPSYLLWAMALISINLGLINLLPIPMLDGGHLVFFAGEAVLRRPLPLRVRELLSLLGFVTILVLGGLALKNDVEKRWDIIVAQATELLS